MHISNPIHRRNIGNFLKKAISAFLLFTQFSAVFITLAITGFAVETKETQAQATEQINYQGKLTDSSGVAVANGLYNMEFKLYSTSTGGSALWTETRTSTDKVQVTDGLFSVMLGSVSSFGTLNFNQPLFLGVNIGGTGSPSWDGEMSPRKTIGSVPSALNSKSLEGLRAYQFIRANSVNSTSTSSAILNIEQTGSGAIAQFVGNSSSTLLGLYSANGGQATFGTTTPVSGAKVTIAGDISLTGALRVNGNTGTNGQILQSTGSGLAWISTSSLPYLLSSTLGALSNGLIPRWNGTSLVNSIVRDNGTVAGINATSSSYTFNIKGTAGTNPFNVATSSGASLFVVNQDGDVGIGTSTPLAQLQVAGSFLAGSSTPLLFVDGTNNKVYLGSTTSGLVASDFQINQYQSDLSTRMHLQNGSNYFLLSVSSSSRESMLSSRFGGFKIMTSQIGDDPILSLYANNGGSSYTRYSVTESDDWMLGTDASDGASFKLTHAAGDGGGRLNDSYGGLTYLTIKTDGSVGIGTTTPGSKLDVWGALRVGTSSTPNLFVDTANGKVGIGTSTPVTPLDVNGVTTFRGNLLSGTNDTYDIGASGNIFNKIWTERIGNSTGQIFFEDGNSTARMTSGVWEFGYRDLSQVLGIGMNGVFTNSSSTAVNSFLGSLGIGTSSPSDKLSVVGGFNLTGALRANGNAGTNGMVLQTTGSGIAWVATSSLGISGGSSNYLTLASGGLQTATSTDFLKAAYFVATSTTATSTFVGAVGIGTTSPLYLLDVKKVGGTGTIIASFGDSANNSRLSFKPYNTSIEAFVQGSFGTTLKLNNGGFTVTDSGNTGNTLFSYDGVGLHANKITSANVAGNTYNQLSLTSNYYSISTATSAINFTTYNSAGSSDQLSKLQIFNGDSGNMLLLPYGGNVGIGSSSPNARLVVTGTSSASTTDLFAVASSTNTQFFTIKSSGRVGVGTTSPTATFSVLGEGYTGGSGFGAPLAFDVLGGTANTGNGGSISLKGGYSNDGSTGGIISIIGGNSDGAGGFGGALNLIGGIGGSFGNGGNVNIAGGGDISGIFAAGGNVLLDGGANLSSVYGNILVGTVGGNLGVGSSTPGSKLSLAGDFSLTGALRVSGNAGTNGMVLQTTGSGLTWVATSSLGISGGSGISGGTNGFLARFISGTTLSTGLFLDNGTVAGINATSSTSTFNIKGSAGLNPFSIASSTGASYLVLDQSGNLGVGSSTPGSKLSLAGDFSLTGALRVSGNAGTNGMVLQTTGSGLTWVATSSLGISGGSGSPGGSSGQVQFNNGGTFGGDANFTFDSVNAFLGLGTSTPSARLVVVGTTTADQIIVGGGTAFPNSPLHIGGNVNSYLQANIQNRSNGGSASSDFVASSDTGTDTTNYVDFGINSSGFNDGAFTIAGANEGYLYSQSSSLAIGVASTSASTSIKFFTGGTMAANERVRIDSTGNVGIGVTSPTEKLSVAGNISIGARADVSPTWTKRSDATAGTMTSGGTTSIGTTSAMAVFNGSMYVGTSKPDGAEIYRYNGSTWTRVSSTTPGAIGTSSVGNINTISSMTVWNGNLYVGTAEPGAAEVYRYDGNSNWTRISSSTAGAFSGNGTTTAIDSISAMAVNGGRLYVGTSKLNGAEIYKYNGPGLPQQQTWTKVSNIASNAGTIGTTANVDAVTVLVSYQGYLYAGTTEGAVAGLYRYDGQGAAGTGFTIGAAAGTFSGTGPSGATTVTGVGSVRTAAVYNGKLYLGIGSSAPAAGTARVVKWDGNFTAGTNYELVSSSTAGIIAEDVGATTGIDRVSAMSVYNDALYVGTLDSTGIAEIYKIDSADTWTKYSSTTAGTISTSTGAQTTAITGVMAMQVYNDDLWVGTEKASAAEVYSFNMTEGQSYNLGFEASSDNADGLQNGLKNKAWIQFQAEETAYNNNGNTNTGKFVFSHGINTVTGAYDLAEDYPTRDDMLTPGDLVSLDTNEKGYVRRAQGKNDKDIIGIYSVDPALRLSQKDPLIDGARAIPVALAGRVPVTVTLENGPIKIGDYLTSSVEPGKAAKATKPGRVIGRALGMYSGMEGEAPSVSVFLGAESISWNDLQNAADDSTALAAGEDVGGVTTVADFVDIVNTRVEDIVFALLNKADNLAIVIANNLTAITASIQDLFVKTLTVLPGGSIALPSGENQIAGVGMLSAGTTDTFIANTQIEEDSVIYLSPTSDIDTPLYVYKKEAGKGFGVRTKRAMTDSDITFDWFFIKTYKPKNSSDEVTTTVGGTSTTTDPTTITSVSTDTQNVTSSGNTTQPESTTTISSDSSTNNSDANTPVVETVIESVAPSSDVVPSTDSSNVTSASSEPVPEASTQ